MATPISLPVACPKCGKPIDPADPFCRHCGLALLPKSQQELMDSYVEAKVDQVLVARLASEESLVRGIGDKAEDVVMRRFRNYFILITAAVGIVGWLGWHSFSDITDSARRRLDPIVADAEVRAKRVQKDIQSIGNTVEETKKEAQQTKKNTDELSVEVDQQRVRVAGQSGELGKKIEDLQRDTDNARRTLDNFRHRMDPSFFEIPRLQNDHDISSAFPNLDIEAALLVGNVPFDKSLKKPGDVFFNVNISHAGIEKAVISTENVRKLIAKLKAAGITPVLGTPMLTGRVGVGVANLDLVRDNVHPSVVFYIDPAKKALAEKLVGVASEFVTFPQPQIQLVQLPIPSTSSNEGIVAMIWAKSGFDAQIFISAP